MVSWLTSAFPLSQSGTKATDIPGSQGGTRPQARQIPRSRPERTYSSRRTTAAAGTKIGWPTLSALIGCSHLGGGEQAERHLWLGTLLLRETLDVLLWPHPWESGPVCGSSTYAQPRLRGGIRVSVWSFRLWVLALCGRSLPTWVHIHTSLNTALVPTGLHLDSELWALPPFKPNPARPRNTPVSAFAEGETRP